MTSDFNYLIFSIFCINDFTKFTDAVKTIFRADLVKGKVVLQTEIPVMDDFINPISGGRHLPRFFCWQSEFYPEQVFFISNYEDGLSNVCRAIHRELKCCYLMCALSHESDSPMYKFYLSDASAKERIILAYKEDKWVFYEKGVPLDVENIDYYNNRSIRKRLNNEIIKEYLLKLGIDLSSIDDKISNGFVLQRKEW